MQTLLEFWTASPFFAAIVVGLLLIFAGMAISAATDVIQMLINGVVRLFRGHPPTAKFQFDSDDIDRLADAVLAPAAGFSDAVATPAPTPGMRVFRVFVEDCLQITLRCPDVASALAEAEHYRQPGDDLCVWEGSRIVGVLNDRPDVDPIRCGYSDGGIPKGIGYFPSGPRPRDVVGRCVIPEAEGRGWFIIQDSRPPEQLEAIRRFCDGDRSQATWAAAFPVGTPV